MGERYLANENFPAAIVRWLRDQGHDVVHAASEHVGEADERLLQVASMERRIVLTFDRDFGELVFHRRQPAAVGVVLFRLRQQSPLLVETILKSFFLTNAEVRGYFTVVSPGSFRQTRLPG